MQGLRAATAGALLMAAAGFVASSRATSPSTPSASYLVPADPAAHATSLKLAGLTMTSADIVWAWGWNSDESCTAT